MPADDDARTSASSTLSEGDIEALTGLPPEAKKRLLPVVDFLLFGRLPNGWNTTSVENLGRKLEQALRTEPQAIRTLLSRHRHGPDAVFRLLRFASPGELLGAITAQTERSQRKHVLALYDMLARLSVPRISPRQLKSWFVACALQGWLGARPESSHLTSLLAELVRFLTRTVGLGLWDIEKLFARHSLSESLRAEIDSVLIPDPKAADSPPIADAESVTPRPIAPEELAASDVGELPTKYRIENAGLVLVQHFIATYFARLELVVDDEFVSAGAQRKAVHCLQYLATGLTETEEQHLTLNKVLCGLHPWAPIERRIVLDSAERELADGLIQAMIGHWEAIGSSSVDGFRGNWLVRNGMLTESDDNWSLVIEKRGYDVLLERAPFSYSVTRLPWMEKPMYVTWPT